MNNHLNRLISGKISRRVGEVGSSRRYAVPSLDNITSVKTIKCIVENSEPHIDVCRKSSLNSCRRVFINLPVRSAENSKLRSSRQYEIYKPHNLWCARYCRSIHLCRPATRLPIAMMLIDIPRRVNHSIWFNTVNVGVMRKTTSRTRYLICLSGIRHITPLQYWTSNSLCKLASR